MVARVPVLDTGRKAALLCRSNPDDIGITALCPGCPMIVTGVRRPGRTIWGVMDRRPKRPGAVIIDGPGPTGKPDPG
ncbi:hypothetical protein JCM14469_16040 [Desulfatiferula olefinivorans]